MLRRFLPRESGRSGDALLLPYHFVGFSQMHVQGGSTLHHINGARVGSFGAGTRMCTTTEYYTSPRLKVPAPGSGGAWVNPVFVASYYDPVRETGMCVDAGLALPCGPLSWNCNNWSLAAITTNPPTTVYGSVIAPPGGTAGRRVRLHSQLRRVIAGHVLCAVIPAC